MSSITKEAAQKIANDLFKHYPDQKEFHITTDGQAFFDNGAASAHAASLGSELDSIFICTRSNKVVAAKQDSSDSGLADEQKAAEAKQAAKEAFDKAEATVFDLEQKVNAAAAELKSTNKADEGYEDKKDILTALRNTLKQAKIAAKEAKATFEAL